MVKAMSPLIPVVIGGVLAFGGGAVTEWLRDRRAAGSAREDRKEVRQEHRDDQAEGELAFHRVRLSIWVMVFIRFRAALPTTSALWTIDLAGR